MELPDGWTNTLDEYITTMERTTGIPWEDAFIVNLESTDE